jgi:uncharacterized protein involved in exopolysaccharide biosynthesis
MDCRRIIIMRRSTMDCPKAMRSLVVILLLSIRLEAAENPEIKALHKEIDALRAQEKAVLKAIRSQYETYVKIDKLSEKELVAERDALDKQEKELLAVATTSEDRAAVKAQYGTLRDALGKGAKLDAKEIQAIRAQEKAHTKLISAAFKAKVQEIEAAIQILEKSQPKGGKK